MSTLAVPPEAPSDTAVPRLPTIVVSSWKGGVWTTCLSASIAERLSFAGREVLYLVTDDQLDARRRLGISEADPDVARVQRGSGTVTVVGLAGPHATDLLYRSGPGRFGRFDAVVVDTPPEVVPVVDDGSGKTRPARPLVAALPRREPTGAIQELPTAILAAILARLEMVPPAVDGVPAWLVEAIGNPLRYDAAAPHRKDVCARVDPVLYRRLQAMKERLALRSTAGAWEYVLWAGLAVAEREGA